MEQIEFNPEVGSEEGWTWCMGRFPFFVSGSLFFLECVLILRVINVEAHTTVH